MNNPIFRLSGVLVVVAAAIAAEGCTASSASDTAAAAGENIVAAHAGRVAKVMLPPGGAIQSRTHQQLAAAAGTDFDYPATEVGAAGDITVMYDPDLGQEGLDLAKKLLTAAATPYAHMKTAFASPGAAHTVIVAPLSGNNDGTGGAYHYGCDFDSGGVLYVDATFATTTVDPVNLEVALYVAELSEAFMGAQGGGWDCGGSNGEGLSRFLAEAETPWGTLSAFTTAPKWAAGGFADWVSRTESTDRDAVSTGCAVAYIDWMRKLGFSTAQIVQAAGTTLAKNYKTLTGKSTGAADLVAAARAVTINSDDPFGIRAAGGGSNTGD
jgi:hypothetical protein